MRQGNAGSELCSCFSFDARSDFCKHIKAALRNLGHVEGERLCATREGSKQRRESVHALEIIY